ncbi:MAG: cytidylate kinase [Candidatus Levybacteria bacterium RIFCSPLOWO2_01_FULL_39_10]|nr:MAG: cytidylate kinase [Candidatus Levybacteria bacterium RIFCSPLOWO2_01_FULL_39_10]
MSKKFILAIDGPVASGKGTLAHLLAEKLDAFYLYTGAMYRGLALYCIENGIDVENEENVKKVFHNLNFDFSGKSIVLNGEDVTEKIKQPEVANKGSIVAGYKSVREFLVELQKKIGFEELNKGRIIIAEGRDIGTKVFPEAQVKIFLVADPSIRAKRRTAQYREKGIEKPYDDILAEINKRDEADTKRSISPLVPAKDSIKVDTTNDKISDTYEKVLKILKEKGFYD